MTSIKLACLALVAALLVIVSAPLAQAAGLNFTYVSSTGSDGNPCTATQPCATIFQAVVSLSILGDNGQVSCLNSPSVVEGYSILGGSFTIDCAGVVTQNNGSTNSILQLDGANQVVKIRNLTFSGVQPSNGAIQVTGSGTLILENCVFENIANGSALQITPNGALNLVITNSRISNNAAGVLIKPAAGGSVTATFNGVTIADNAGGGLKTDTTNGFVTVDISNSTVSKNGGNGMNAVGGAGGSNVLNLSHDVITSNLSAGVQANGTNAAVLIDTTLLDSNAAGATSVVGAGHVLTYGNNRIIGNSGSGFTGPAPLQ